MRKLLQRIAVAGLALATVTALCAPATGQLRGHWRLQETIGTTSVNDGQWHHVAGVYTGSQLQIYIDGVLNNSVASWGAISTNHYAVEIGRNAEVPGREFDGAIYNVLVYNGLLPNGFIQLIYNYTGLIGHWRLSESSGTSATDSTLIVNSGTYTNGVALAAAGPYPGAGDKAADFDGSNALLTDGAGGIAQTTAVVRPPDVGTVAFWMRSTGAPAATSRIVGIGADWEVRQNADGRVISDLCGDGHIIIGTTTPLTEVGRWYHFAATFDSSDDTYALYVDGQLQLAGINPMAMTQQPANILSFGTRTGSTEYWSGALRDVRIYSRRLCPSEIAELAGLVGHWKMDETSGTVAADSSAHGRNATVVGTAAWVPGAVDDSLQLNGATRAEVASLLGAPRNVSMACWARLGATGSGGAEIVSIGDYFAIRLDEGSLSRAFFYNGSGWTFLSVNQTFAGTGWHHFAAVFNDDLDTCKFFIDGAEVASLNTTVTIPYAGLGTTTIIGAHGNGQTYRNFTGRVDDIRIYSRALCASEIQELFEGGNAFEGVKIIKWVELQ